MAISLVGTASNNGLNGANLTVTFPGGVAQNDVVYAAYNEVTATVDLNVSTVTAGYTELADLYANDNLDVNLGVYRKVQGVTPDSTVVFTGSGGSSNSMAGAAMVLRGVDTTTPEDATTTNATGINGPTPDPASITTVTANAWVLAIGASTEGDIPTAPTNYSDLIEDQGADTNPANVMMARRLIVAAGAEDPGTFGAIVGDANDSWAAATVAVRPAIVAGAGGFPFMSAPFLPMLVR